MGCLRRLLQFFVSLVILLLLLLIGGYFLLYNFIQNELPDEVRRHFMLPPSADVNIQYGNLLDTLNGRVRIIDISSKEAVIEGLRIENLEFHSENIKVNLLNVIFRKPPIVESAGESNVAFRVAVEEIANAWLKRGAKFGLRNISISLRKISSATEEESSGIDAKVDAKVEFFGKSVEVSFDGKFTLKDGEILFNLLKTDGTGFELKSELLDKLILRFAPKIKVNQLDKNLVITKFSIEGNYIVIEAETE